MARLSLLQRQTANLEAQQNRLAESIRKRMKIEPKNLVNLMESDDFSLKRLRENCVRNESRLMEANADSAFGQLLRYGVQHFMFDAYQSVSDFIYPDLVSVRPSTNRQEWYAPLYGVEIPRDVPVGGKFEDSKISGLDRELVNKKVGRMFSVERELIDDDQTGQVEQRANGLGERLRYKEEADVLGVDVFTLTPLGRGVVGAAGVSYTTAKGNRPTTYANLAQAGLENADIALHNILDPVGNRIMVKPSLLLVSPADKFNAAKLLNSALQPSVPGAPGQTYTTASSGLIGYTGTVNALQGLYTLKVSRFLPANYWYLIEPKTSIVFQDRDPLELTMEARDAGTSFERDEYRWRIRRRYATDVLEYLYLYCGNGV
jgi:phage major head subunit gpT-like protein